MDYQEKLRLAKKALDSGSYDKETIEYIFPELKESNDEGIRKALKSFFDSEISDYGNVEWRNGIRYGEIVSWLEKQGEQKPTEWSDRDWYYYSKLESFLEVKDHYSPTESSSGYQKDVYETLIWLKSLRPNKYVTWSEEDERYYDSALWHIKNSCGKEGNVYNWLESLKERLKGE